MNKYNLFLDDFRTPQLAFNHTFNSDYLKKEWDVVKSYDEFTKHIIEKLKCGYWPALISFDHDLADEHYIGDVEYDNYLEKTGYHCAKWLIDICIDKDLRLPEFLIHSMNPVGSENITKLLQNFKKFQDEN